MEHYLLQNWIFEQRTPMMINCSFTFISNLLSGQDTEPIICKTLQD